MEYSIEHFYDFSGNLFFYTSDTSETLIARKIEIQDNVIPSSNSVSAKNLLSLGIFFDSSRYTEMSKDMVKRIKGNIKDGGPYFANWAFLYGLQVNNPTEITINGNNALSINNQLQRKYLPDCIIIDGNQVNLPVNENKNIPGNTQINICQGKTCYLACDDIEKALDYLNNNIPLTLNYNNS